MPPEIALPTRHDHSGIRDRRLRDHTCDGQFPLDGIQIVVRHDSHVTGGVGEDAAALRRDRPVLEGGQQFVRVPVVFAVEHQHDVAARVRAGDTKGLGVGECGR